MPTGTEVWGPPLWTAIHHIALGYPDKPGPEQKTDYRRLFEALGATLPCAKCGEHYAAHMREMPVAQYLDSRHELFGWTVELHNAVNRSLGKPEWDARRAMQLYSEGVAARPVPGLADTMVFLTVGAVCVAAIAWAVTHRAAL